MRVQCAVAGGGPAGMMPGCFLARAGGTVVVLESTATSCRIPAATIHPSTLA